MAKIGRIEREEKVAKAVERYAEKRAALKKIIRDKSTSAEDRHAAVMKLSCLPRMSSPVRKHNRCRIDGRPRGFLRKYGMSRIWFRVLASNGQLPGVVKSSW